MVQKKTEEAKTSKYTGVLKSLGSHLVTLLIGFAIGVLTPIGQRIGDSIVGAVFAPDVGVQLTSVLCLSDQGDNLVDLKLGIRVESDDPSDRTIQPIFLKSLHTGKQVDLSDSEPIVVGQGAMIRQQLTVSTPSMKSQFFSVPVAGDAGWVLGYRITGSSQVLESAVDSADLERLHFFIVPDDTFFVNAAVRSQFIQIGHSSNVWELDERGWNYHGMDSLNILLYPTNQLLVEIDTSENGVSDLLVRCDSFPAYAGNQGTTIGRVNAVVPDFTSFLNPVSGFVIGIRSTGVLPDSVTVVLLKPETRKQLTRVFGQAVDKDVPLGRRNFIYWKYSQ